MCNRDISVHYGYHAQVLILHIYFLLSQTEPRAYPKGQT